MQARAKTGVILALTLASLSGCSTFDDAAVVHHGYVFNEQSAAQIRVGSAAEQALAVMGTPTTTSTVGGDAWYYINQKLERSAPFLPHKVTEQRVFAIYFNEKKKVVRTANYGLEDGRVVDISTRQTVTGGGENRLLQTLLNQFGRYKMF